MPGLLIGGFLISFLLLKFKLGQTQTHELPEENELFDISTDDSSKEDVAADINREDPDIGRAVPEELGIDRPECKEQGCFSNIHPESHDSYLDRIKICPNGRN